MSKKKNSTETTVDARLEEQPSNSGTVESKDVDTTSALEEAIDKLKESSPRIADVLRSLLVNVKANTQIKQQLNSLVEIPPQSRKIDLPSVAQNQRPTPIPFLRNALFGMVERGKRKVVQQTYLKDKKRALELSYIGFQLDQKDLDVWMAFLSFYQKQANSYGSVDLSQYEFLEQLGQTNTGPNRDSLKESLKRLSTGAVYIENQDYIYSGHLLEWSMDKKEGKLTLWMNHRLESLFYGAAWSKVNWEIRRALGADQLAKWLHGFYSTHNGAPVPYSIEKIQELCGSSCKRLRDFKLRLQKALEKVSLEYQTQGETFHWEIDENDNVIVSFNPRAWIGR